MQRQMGATIWRWCLLCVALLALAACGDQKTRPAYLRFDAVSPDIDSGDQELPDDITGVDGDSFGTDAESTSDTEQTDTTESDVAGPDGDDTAESDVVADTDIEPGTDVLADTDVAATTDAAQTDVVADTDIAAETDGVAESDAIAEPDTVTATDTSSPDVEFGTDAEPGADAEPGTDAESPDSAQPDSGSDAVSPPDADTEVTAPECLVAADCQAAGVCQVVSCTGGICQVELAADGTACNDGDACTLADTCQGGTCVAGAVRDCDDGDVCTTDACNSSGNCTYVSADGLPCDDGNACTSDGVCSAGGCSPGTTSSCDDGNACTLDGCDPQDGCLNLPTSAPCSDGDVCTVGDTCLDATCWTGAPASCSDGEPCTTDSCDATDGCVFLPNSASCTDDNVCTLNDSCSGGVCLPGTTTDCNDNNLCTTDSCVPDLGCAVTATTASCNDGNVCSLGDTCAGGQCLPGSPLLCNDGNPCTTDSCDSMEGCRFVPNTLPCTDNNNCTEGDTCNGGECVPQQPSDCDDGNPCTTESCDGGVGCTTVDNTEPCVDGNVCTVGDTCGAGECQPGSVQTCQDGQVCTTDACDPATGCLALPVDGPCDDGNVCTLADSCGEGQCLPGDPTSCTDNNACTTDSCLPAGDGAGCQFVPNTLACLDGNLCTTGDQCGGGVCLPGTATTCNDNNPCTTDSCSPATGCDFAANDLDCEDGNACTSGDTCGGGVCLPGSATDCSDTNPCTSAGCNPQTGCFQTNNTAPCVDGSVCTYQDTCSGGVCLPGSATTCDDANPCTTDGCDPQAGCTFTDNSLACADGDACTTNDTCSGGSCLGGPARVCDDGLLCTTDGCDPATGCTTTNNILPCDDNDVCSLGDTCGGGVCLPGVASVCDDDNLCTTNSCDPSAGCQFEANSLPCDDEDACTFGDTCGGTVCLPGTATVCDDGNPCSTDGCNPSSGCVAVANTAPCSDNNLCTLNDMCGGGVCLPGPATVCGDNNPCTNDSCDPQNGCTFVANTLPCDDGSACSLGDTCLNGGCEAGAPATCNDGKICTTDGCDPLMGCTFEANTSGCDDDDACTAGDTCGGGVCLPGAATVCDDGNPCTNDGCDPQTGCTADFNTASCNDNNLCTTGDLCSGGACLPGSPTTCDDNNPCTDDGCDAVLGCTFVANSSACQDGNACTTNDGCLDGDCVPGIAVVCDDDNACTDDGCNPAKGCYIASNTLPCDDGDACTVADQCGGNTCLPGMPLSCNDDNLCTSDSCDPSSGCTFLANSLPCSDNNACTTMDLCNNKLCQPGLAALCNDGNDCTSDSCDPATGCSYTPTIAPCSDGNACTANDTCSGGGCASGSAVNCDDSVACTVDSCDSLDGCLHAPNQGLCDDSVACTTDSCTSTGCSYNNVDAACDDDNVCTQNKCNGLAGCVFPPANLTASLTTFYTGGGNIRSNTYGGVAVDAAGNVYMGSLSGSNSGRRMWNAAGTLLALNTTPTTGLLAHNGQVYALEPATCNGCTGGAIVQLSNSGGNLVSTVVLPTTTGTGLPAQLAIDKDGNFWVAHGNSGSIVKVSPTGQQLLSITGLGNRQTLVTAGDYIYTADYNGSLRTFSLNGIALSSTFLANMGNIVGLTVGPDGLLYVGAAISTGLDVYETNMTYVGHVDTPALDWQPTFQGGALYSANSSLGVYKYSLGPSCTDGNACTQVDSCVAGSCVGSNPVVCTALNQCHTVGSCDTGTGVCSQPQKPNATSCEDGDACTTPDTCQSGNCQSGVALTCVDGNTCTDDSCNSGSGCTYTDNNNSCSDGEVCTENDTCSGGQCQSGPVNSCDDGRQCTSDSCLLGLGCSNKNRAGSCNDGNACTSADFCNGGSCTFAMTVNCDDGNPCTNDSCDTALGCIYAINEEQCDDGDACSGLDLCVSGVCTGSQYIDCLAPFDVVTTFDQGTTGAITSYSESGVVVTKVSGTISIGNFNTFDSDRELQLPASAASFTIALENGAPFDLVSVVGAGGAGAVTFVGTKQGGGTVTANFTHGANGTTISFPSTYEDVVSVTVTSAAASGASNTHNFDAFVLRTTLYSAQCQQPASCDPATGACVILDKPLGAACVEDDLCTAEDFCDTGVCISGAAPADCNDGNVCTDDSCVAPTGCVHTANTAGCEDGNACTENDLCSSTSCLAGSTKVCNDNNPCTTDSCSPNIGCVFSNNTAACDDGDSCTGNDACASGTCTGTQLAACAYPTSGLVARYAADKTSSITTDSEGKVTAWDDLSGQGNHLATSGQGPVVVNDQFGTLTGLEFTLSTGLRTQPFPLTSNVTFLAVVKWNSMAAGRVLAHHGDKLTDWALGKSNTGDLMVFRSNSDETGGGISVTSGGTYVVSGRMNGSTRQLQAIGNSVVSGAATGNTIVAEDEILTIGAGGAALGANAVVGEILYYNRALTDMERDQATAYLHARWGLTPPTPTFLWLDSMDASTLTTSGTTVTQWNDKSGLGRHASVSGAGPTLKPTGTPSGRPSIEFNGGNVRLQTASVPSSPQMTIFVSYKMVSPQAWGAIIAQDHDVYFSLRMSVDTQLLNFHIRNNNFGIGLNPNYGTWQVVTCMQSASETSMYYNQSSVSSLAQSAINNGSAPLSIGNAYGKQESMGGQIAEIRAFSSVLSATERYIIETHMRLKTGL